MIDSLFGSYEGIASEYYDSSRHPTCANFREASAQILGEWLRSLDTGRKWLCEVGAGKSMLAEFLTERDDQLDHLILVDASRSMLAYSRHWANCGTHFVVGDAAALPILSNSLNLLVSSLGDPYNKTAYWMEVHRTLRVGGISLFTIPSYDWAVSFRSSDHGGMMSAEFEVLGDRIVEVPSLILPVHEQTELIEENGLVVREIVQIALGELKSQHLSTKLVPERGPNATIVTGYFVTKA